ncbi:hypothetical protein PS903_02227 [Pseudomonas fluorescens]|nr:hypothetical protein PS903_02227 [Pseudomonas fluorescens]
MKLNDSLRVLFEYVTKRNSSENGFLQSIVSMYARNARWSTPSIRLLIHGLAFLVRPRAQKKYIFWGIKFEELILSLPKEHICIVGGPKQLVFCLKHRRSFLPALAFWKPLLNELQYGPTAENDKCISSCLTGLSNDLRHIATDDAMLIVDNDSLPAQRTVIQAASLARFQQTICIQHGIFQRRSPTHILDGWFADRLLVIDQNQKDMFIDKGMSPDKIRVMGFHSSPYRPERPISPPHLRKVCLIGQPWGKYDEAKGELYLQIFKKVSTDLLHAGCTIFFKPHPWEQGNSYLSEIPNVVNISMQEALENYDVFISLTSTALLEAGNSGRIAIQIVNSAFDSDRLSELYSVTSIDYDNLEFEHDLGEAVLATNKSQEPAPKPLIQRFITCIGQD